MKKPMSVILWNINEGIYKFHVWPNLINCIPSVTTTGCLTGQIDFNFNKTSFWQSIYTSLYKNFWKFCVEYVILNGQHFVAYGLVDISTIFAIFDISRFFFYLRSYFSYEKDPGAVKIVSYILKNLFDQKFVKIVIGLNTK